MHMLKTGGKRYGKGNGCGKIPRKRRAPEILCDERRPAFVFGFCWPDNSPAALLLRIDARGGQQIPFQLLPEFGKQRPVSRLSQKHPDCLFNDCSRLGDEGYKWRRK